MMHRIPRVSRILSKAICITIGIGLTALPAVPAGADPVVEALPGPALPTDAESLVTAGDEGDRTASSTTDEEMLGELGEAVAAPEEPAQAKASGARLLSSVPAINRQDKAAVAAAYRNILLAAEAVPMGWTGSISSCVPGTVSAAAQEATFDAINYFRRMVGLAPVTESVQASHVAQKSALMFQANGGWNHYPPKSWACFSNNGAFIAARSNVHWNVTGGLDGYMAGAKAVTDYVKDAGVASLGHRRWILSAGQGTMGSGSTNNSNALVWGNGEGACTRPECTVEGWSSSEDAPFTNTYSVTWATPQLVAWPGDGFFPWQLTERFGADTDWSVATGTASISFGGATVTVTKNGTAVPGVTVVPQITLGSGYGDRGAFAFSFPAGVVTMPSVGQVDTYHVSISGITGYSGTFQYDVKMFNPVEATISSVSITGTPQVGQVLTAVVGSVDPADATLSYQWLRDGTTAVGYSSAYTPTSADVGHTLSVRVTPSKTSFTSYPLTSAAQTVAVGSQLVAKPVISGVAQVGEELTVAQVSVTPPYGTVTYAWLVDGVQVTTGSSSAYRRYTPDATTSGKSVMVRVTATQTGYEIATNDSDMQTIAPGWQTIDKPVILGTARVGEALTVDEMDTVPSYGNVRYIWLVGGAEVRSGYGSAYRSYTPVESDYGKSVLVRVTATRTGYVTATNESEAKTIGLGTQTVPKPVIIGAAQVGGWMTVDDVWPTPAGATVTYAWLMDGIEVKSGTDAEARLYKATPAD